MAASFLSGLVMVVALEAPAVARPGNDHGALIDRYCIDRGRLRVAAHQSHCAACHQPGTFDSTAGHRVQPNWTEFERGRSTGVFDFFCPAPQAVAATAPPSGATATAPPTGSSAWPPPREPAVMGAPPAAPGTAAGAPVPAGQAPVAAPSGKVQPAGPESTSGPSVATSQIVVRLTALHTTLGVTAAQEPAWREFADAVVAATRSQPPDPGTAPPAARLRGRELVLSERIVALRSVNRALSRLGARLDDTQRRLLSDGFAQLLDVI